MLTNELMTVTLVLLNVLFFVWMFVIGLYHYFLHQELRQARHATKRLEDAYLEYTQATKDLRKAEDIALLRCKFKCDNK